MAEGISQHKQIAMGMKSSGQRLAKGGAVREEGARHERTESRAMERREDAGKKGGARPNPFAKGKK